MNYAIVFRLLGYVMLIEGALLLLPAAASWIYGEWFVLGVFLITAAVSAAMLAETLSWSTTSLYRASTSDSPQ